MTNHTTSWSKRMVDIIRHRYAVAERRRARKPNREPREARIRSQVEFYYSDANLRRDKYMHNLFEKDIQGWLSAGDLRQFPILRTMRCTEREILDACTSSDLLIVDYASRRIKRDFELWQNQEIIEQIRTRSVPPPGQPSALEKRTIYVEQLPILMDQERLREEIKKQLPDTVVKYVSIPRHSVTGESYGCAFIEVGSEEEAKQLSRKWRKVDSDTFNAKYGRMGRTVRVMTLSKFNALKRRYISARSLNVKREQRLSYYPAYDPKPSMDLISSIREENKSPSSDSDSAESNMTSSVMSASAVNSLAQDSVDVRRSRNASSIRSNSVVFISDLPPTPSINVHVWLSHSAAVQFLDHKAGDTTAHARFASKSERDFFLKDFENSRIPLCGVFPVIRPLSEEECTQYFEAERERRRSQIQGMGHPDSWETPRKNGPEPTGLEPEDSKTTNIPILQEGRTPALIAFTDIVSGNPTLGEPGTSVLYGIEKGRHIAREKFFNLVRPIEYLCDPEGPESRKRCSEEDDSDYNNIRKRVKLSDDDYPSDMERKRPRNALEVKTYNFSPKKHRVAGKRTRRGRRGGSRSKRLDQ